MTLVVILPKISTVCVHSDAAENRPRLLSVGAYIYISALKSTERRPLMRTRESLWRRGFFKTHIMQSGEIGCGGVATFEPNMLIKHVAAMKKFVT